ncbi:MAG TPA: VOC family protein [Caulobacteraceae bacterium]|nr:VOC family protein [Caulobacteraceae bacterium]
MPNHLSSFAIHAEDPDRARAFYEAVFGWRFEPWGPPGFYLIDTGDGAPQGVQGIMHGRVQRTVTPGVEVTFSASDLDAIIAAVEANGGKMIMQKSAIPTVGTLIRFLDPEGNDIGAMKRETPART